MSLILTGLDGANPQGFLAALGVQQALADQGSPTRMRWVDDGGWRPELLEMETFDEIVGLLEKDLATWKREPALNFNYPARDKKTGNPKKKGKIQEIDQVRDLKSLPEEYAEYMRQMRARGGRSEQLALAFATDVGIDGSGHVKPNDLHFLAGQQRFLEMVIELRDSITPEHLREAIEGPWLGQDDVPVFDWNATSGRMHALRAFDPSKKNIPNNKKTSTAGAEWLSFTGLRCLPTVPDSPRSNMTTGAFGSWKHGSFRWLIWSAPLSNTVVSSALQQTEKASGFAASALEAWGITQIFESTIHRTDQGGYGSFSPPAVIR